ncbi:MAG: hypothetical protein JW786_04740 [Desulfobacterales bacterium]|nr:hypothetical protein [Desulfobacterales bacterium]
MRKVQVLLIIFFSILFFSSSSEALNVDLGAEYTKGKHYYQMSDFKFVLNGDSYMGGKSKLEFEKENFYLTAELMFPHFLFGHNLNLSIKGGLGIKSYDGTMKDSDWLEKTGDKSIYSESELSLDDSLYFQIEEDIERNRLFGRLGYKIVYDNYTAYNTSQESKLAGYTADVAGETLNYELYRHSFYFALGYHLVELESFSLGLCGKFGGFASRDKDRHVARTPILEADGSAFGYLYGIETCLHIYELWNFQLTGTISYETYYASGEMDQSAGQKHATAKNYKVEGNDTTFALKIGYRF